MMPSDDSFALLRKASEEQPASSAHPASAESGWNISPQAWVQEKTRIAVGRGVNVSGKLIFQEPVRIEGCFKGEVISSGIVVIAEGGSVDGCVRARTLIVMGEVHGQILDSSRVYLGPRSRVYGEVSTDKLTLIEGAHLEGSVRMTGVGPQRPKNSPR